MTPLSLRDNDLSWREIDDEIVALDGQGAVYLSVRGAGALVWRLLADSTDRDRLVQAVSETYDVDSDQATRDVETFLAQLEDRELLVS